MTGEDIMKDHNSRQYGFLPAVISPLGKLGNVIDRFLFGADTYPLPSFDPTKFPHAKKAAEIATSVVVPDGILKQADKIWREQHPGETYGRNYKEMTPSVSACQKLGQLVCVANGTHILNAIDKMNGEPILIDDAALEEMNDWLSHEREHDKATCQETAGFATLLNLGEDPPGPRHERYSCLDSSSSLTDMPTRA